MKKSEVRKLLISLKHIIEDEHRCSCDEENLLDGERALPGMDVTIACNKLSSKDWSWQTGDNSYTGGAYHYQNWAFINLYRRSNCSELAQNVIDQLDELES